MKEIRSLPQEVFISELRIERAESGWEILKIPSSLGRSPRGKHRTPYVRAYEYFTMRIELFENS